jgi:hypothetical protein
MCDFVLQGHVNPAPLKFPAFLVDVGLVMFTAHARCLLRCVATHLTHLHNGDGASCPLYLPLALVVGCRNAHAASGHCAWCCYMQVAHVEKTSKLQALAQDMDAGCKLPTCKASDTHYALPLPTPLPTPLAATASCSAEALAPNHVSVRIDREQALTAV